MYEVTVMVVGSSVSLGLSAYSVIIERANLLSGHCFGKHHLTCDLFEPNSTLRVATLKLPEEIA